MSFVGGEPFLVRDDEHHATVVILQDEGVIAVVLARHDDMAALHEAHIMRIIAAKGTLLGLARVDSGEWDRLLPWQREILEPGRIQQ